MDKFEKLVLKIMKECEADGEPVTREEAEERRRNSPLSKLGRWLKSAATKIVEEEE